MTIETILEYLNAVPVRATYGAVGEVLGVRPQVVPRLLGARRPEASWVVNGTTGEPTGYAPEEVDPRLPGTRVIRSGDELRRGLESETAPAPEAVSAASEAVSAAPEAVSAVPEAVSAAREAVPAVNSMAAPRMEDAEIISLGSDAKWIIGTLVPVLLLVAGLLATQIASVGGSLNDRLDDVNQRLDDLRADLSAQIADVNARIDDVRSELNDEIAALGSEVRSFDARLRAVEVALGIGPSTAPAPDEGEQTSDPDAPAADPDAPAPDPEPDPPTDTAPPAANPVPPPE